jgi:hypothetical protein
LNLTFLNSAYLFGLFAAAIPIVIHLLSRKRAVIYRFAAIDFILRSHRRVARRLRLKQLILMVLRTLMIVLIALSLSRPLLKRSRGVAFSQPGPSSSVIIIDNSFSMGYQLKGKSLFAEAKKAARRIVDSLEGEDNALIILCNSSPQVLLPDLTFNKSALEKAIAEAQLSFAPTDIGSCLSQARQVLSGSPLADKYLYLLTDLTKNGWRAESFYKRKGEEAEKIQLKVLDLSSGQRLPNRAIAGIEVAPVFREGRRDYSFKIKAKNFAPEPSGDLLCQLYLGEQEISRGFLKIPAGGEAVKDFSCPPGLEGAVFGRVDIAQDNLTQDDTRYFKFSAGREIQALVVDGDPRSRIYQSESFYLEKALNPQKNSRSLILPTISTREELSDYRFADFDLVILSNVEQLSSEKILELKRFVGDGGGLFITLGDRVDPDRYNQSFGELLPRPLRGISKVFLPGEGGQKLKEEGLDHPIVRIFQAAGGGKLGSANFFKIYLVEPSPEAGGDIIVRYDNDAPALLEREWGKGRVIVFTSTIDRDWNDLPIRTVYLPLIHQISQYLARTLTGEEGEEILVGQPKSLTWEEKEEAIRVIDPRGKITLLPGKVKEGRREANYRETLIPGFYNVLGQREGGDKLTEAGFAVNVDLAESDLTRISPEEITKLLGEEGVELIREDYRLSRGAGTGEQEYKLWGTLLFGILILAALEGLVVRNG